MHNLFCLLNSGWYIKNSEVNSALQNRLSLLLNLQSNKVCTVSLLVHSLCWSVLMKLVCLFTAGSEKTISKWNSSAEPYKRHEHQGPSLPRCCETYRIIWRTTVCPSLAQGSRPGPSVFCVLEEAGGSYVCCLVFIYLFFLFSSNSLSFFFLSLSFFLGIFTSLWNFCWNHFIWTCVFRNGWMYFHETWSCWILRAPPSLVKWIECTHTRH